MNAVYTLVGKLQADALRRVFRGERKQTNGERLRRSARRRFGDDLASFLNRLRRTELDWLCSKLEIERASSVGLARFELWKWGARLEAGDERWFGTPVQPVPALLRGKLVHFRARPGLAPAAERLPRTVSAARDFPTNTGEPQTLEELLDRACGLIGLRLGALGRDKGAHGTLVSQLLGVRDSGHSEPDWRGEVEIKTVPVVRDQAGLWWVKEDPAISMADGSPLTKLRRVLWVVRVADEPTAPILSWFYQEWDEALAKLVARFLHTRPKGGAGATTRGWYLHKKFFVDSGLLLSLNG